MSITVNDLTFDRYEKNRKSLSFQFVSPRGTSFKYEKDQKRNSHQNKPFRKLALFVEELFRFQSYEYQSPYSFHKYAPSARGMYCLYPYVICMGYVWLYDAPDHRWVCIGYVPSKVQAVEIIISCDFWRLCSVYGSFGLALGLLELGHMTADIKMDSEDHGFPVKKVGYMFNRWHYSKILKAPEDILLGCLIEFEQSKPIDQPDVRHNIYKYKKTYNYQKELLQIGIMDYINALTKMDESLKNNDWFYEESSKGNKAHRHSGNHVFGLLDISSAYCNKTFLALVLFLQNTKGRMNRSNQFSIYIAVQNIEDWNKGIYYITENGCKLISSDFEIKKFFYDTYDFFEIERSPFTLFVTYTGDGETNQESIYYAHVGAAGLIQYVARYMADGKAYTRPIKNINDLYCHEKFKTKPNEQVIYAMLFGYNNTGMRKVEGRDFV